jgi:hypothetical protein
MVVVKVVKVVGVMVVEIPVAVVHLVEVVTVLENSEVEVKKAEGVEMAAAVVVVGMAVVVEMEQVAYSIPKFGLPHNQLVNFLLKFLVYCRYNYMILQQMDYLEN